MTFNIFTKLNPSPQSILESYYYPKKELHVPQPSSPPCKPPHSPTTCLAVRSSEPLLKRSCLPGLPSSFPLSLNQLAEFFLTLKTQVEGLSRDIFPSLTASPAWGQGLYLVILCPPASVLGLITAIGICLLTECYHEQRLTLPLLAPHHFFSAVPLAPLLGTAGGFSSPFPPSSPFLQPHTRLGVSFLTLS